MAGYPGTIAAHLAARRPRRPAHDALGRRARRQQRADRPVHHPQPVVFLRRVAGARADQPRQPAHPARSREVRRVRAAVLGRRAVRRRERAGGAGRAGRGGVRPPRRRAVELDQRVVSGRRRQPAVGVVGQLRRGRPDRRRARDRARPTSRAAPSTLHEKAIYIVEGAAVSGGAAGLRRPQGVRARGRVRLLHDRHHLHEGHDSGHVRRSGVGRWSSSLSARGAPPPRALARRLRASLGKGARRGPRRLARRGLQEDQVLHQRERRLRRAGSARAADAHVVVLADDSRGGDGRRCRSPPTIGATAWSASRSRCATSRSCC